MAAVRLFRSAACAWQTIFLVSALIMAASAAVSMDRRTQSALAAQGPAQAEEAPVIVTASGDPEALEPGMVRADVVAKNGELVRAQTAHKKNTSHIAVLARDLSISTTFSEVAAEGTIINLHPLTEADKKPMKFAFHSNFTGRGLDITAVITKTDAVRLREHPNDSTATLKTFNIRLVYNKGKITVATQSLNSDAYTAVGCDTFSSDEFYDSDDDELQVLPETEMKQLPAGLLGKCRDCNAYLGNLLGDRYVFLIDSTNHVQYMQGSDWAIAFTEFQHVEKNSNQQVSGAEALKKLAGSSFESLVKRCASDQPKLQALPNDDIAAIAAQIRADEGGSSAYPLFSSSSESSQKKSKQSSSSSASKQSRATLIELDNSVESNQRAEVQGSCYDDQRGNGRCDEACNNAANHWDGGDCCRGTCVNGVTNTEAARRGGRVYPCGINGYNCVGSAYDKHCAFLHGFGLWGPAEAANKQWQLPNKDLNDAQVGQLGGAAKIPYNKMSVEKVETSSAGPTQDSFAHGTPALDGRSGWFAESALVKALGGGKGNPQDIALKYAGYWADMAWQLRGVCSVVSYQHANTYQFGWDHTQLQQDYADLAKQVNEYKPAKKEGVKHVGGEVFAHSMANNILAGACASSGQCTPWWSLSGGLRGSQAMNYNIFYRGHKHSVADKAKSRARTQRAAYSLTTVYAEPNKRDALVKEAQGRRAATVKGAAQGHGALIKGAVCGYSAWGSYSAAGIGLKALQDAAYPQAPCDDNVNGEACLRTYGDGVVHMSECALSATPTATSPQPWLAGQSFVRDDFRRKFFMWKGNHFGSTGNEHNANRFFDWLRLAAMGRLSNSNSVIFKPHKNPRLEKIKQQRQSHGK